MDWLRQLPIGQYVDQGGSWLRRLDPRLKDLPGIEDTEAVALIAYLKRLGTDLSKPATPVVVEKGK